VKTFNNTTSAFEYYYSLLNKQKDNNGTKSLYNVMFKIKNTEDIIIKSDYRNFKTSYAEKEWQWYLSKNRSAKDISKIAKIWCNHMDENGNVNSNYGWQWSRNNQINYVINELKRDKYTRRAVLTIYDGKEHNDYKYDTPCTLNLQFYYEPNDTKLNMTVIMRSNDLWFGFCNDSYCFLKLHKLICDKLNTKQGYYVHYVQNLHIYQRHYL